MKKGLIRKGLVFSVIALFITVGVQPVFAGESITSTLDNDEDCIECQVSDGISLLRAKILLYRIKAIVNIISFKFDDNPKIQNLCNEINNILNTEYNSVLCTIFSALTIYALFLFVAIGEIVHDLKLEGTFIGNSINLALLGFLGFAVGFMYEYCIQN